MIADLTGSTALITGAGQGIGRGIALVMAEQGADIALADLPSGSAADVAKEVEALGRSEGSRMSSGWVLPGAAKSMVVHGTNPSSEAHSSRRSVTSE